MDNELEPRPTALENFLFGVVIFGSMFISLGLVFFLVIFILAPLPSDVPPGQPDQAVFGLFMLTGIGWLALWVLITNGLLKLLDPWIGYTEWGTADAIAAEIERGGL